MSTQAKTGSNFASRWGFLLSCVGSAVGMANVWGFPYRLGIGGGGAYLVAYLICAFVFSYAGLSAEYSVGRKSRTGTVGTYDMAWKSGGKSTVFGRYIGWLPLIGSMCIAIGYAVIISYVFRAFTDSMTGTIMSVNTGTWFESFSLNEYSVIGFHILVVVGTLLTLLLGAKSIETSNKIMMPIFFLIFLVLAVRVSLLPGAAEGYRFLFTPVWSELLKPWVWVLAMSQAFFSLSVTGSGMIVYGAYLDDRENVVKLALQTAVFDTCAAVLASLVVIPACFAYGVDVAGGPSLLFVVLPQILQDVPMGQLFAAILYLAMIFAGVSSLQNMFEVVVESILYRFKACRRAVAMIIVGVICLGVGLNMEPIFKWGPWMDLVSIYIIPIGATIGAISWFWGMKKQDILDEINKGATAKQGTAWYRVGKYLYVPLAALLCIISLVTRQAL